jgi:uncharacterized membrane protein
MLAHVIKKLPKLYKTRRFYYCVHKNPPLVHMLKKVNAVHVRSFDFFKYILILFNITLGLPSCFCPPALLTKPLHASLLTLRVVCPAHLILFYVIVLIASDKEHKS